MVSHYLQLESVFEQPFDVVGAIISMYYEVLCDVEKFDVARFMVFSWTWMDPRRKSNPKEHEVRYAHNSGYFLIK